MRTLKESRFMVFLRDKVNAAAVTVTTFIALIVLTVCLFLYTLTHALGNYLTQQTEVLGSSLATQAAFNATQSILTNDLLSLNVLLNRLVIDENILSARVFNKKDELLAEADSSQANRIADQDYRPSDQRRIYSSSIKFRDEIVGHVLITLDKTPAQATLQHLNNLLIGVAIFSTTIAAIIILLITRWLYNPINDASYALESLVKGHKDIPLPQPKYREAKQLCQQIESVQALDFTPQTPPVIETEEVEQTPEKAQFEINFDEIFAESQKRSCVLYIDIVNLSEWHKSMSELQVANLLTPIYRAIFQASDLYLGQVKQYKNDGIMIFYSATDCEDNLYLNAVSTAQLFLGLVDQLVSTELYEEAPTLEFHLGLHKGNSKTAEMVHQEDFVADDMGELLTEVEALRQSHSTNVLLLNESIFTLPHIQNRVFTGLPEILEHNDEELMAYAVKGLSGKYQQKVQQHIEEMSKAVV